MDSTPHLDLHLGEGDLFGGALAVLASIRPSWPKDRVKSKIFTDGITNKLIGCWLDSDPESVVLVRVYGQNTDLLIDRKAETFNFKVLHKAGYAPNLYATFTNGLAYEFVPGDVLTTESVRQLSIYPLVARMMAKLHKVDCGPTAKKTPLLWDKINRYLEVIVSDGVADKGNMDKLPYDIETIKMEVDYLRDSLKETTSKVVFCHNDLLVANIIHRDGKITFIDYEYAGYNYQAFDIGNHFAEFAGVSGVNYKRYPGKDFQMTWLKIYLDEFLSAVESTSIDETAVEELYFEVNKFSLASHLLWACWALVQAQHSTIDFDFIGYSKVRMDEYFSKKELFLSLFHSF